MRYARIALFLVVATVLSPLATSAFAELGHPSGCLSCSPVEVPGPTDGYYHEGGIGSVLSGGFLPGTPETHTAAGPKIRHIRRHTDHAEVR
jgi:hypothetical protein